MRPSEWISVDIELPQKESDGKLFLTYSSQWEYMVSMFHVKGTYEGFDFREEPHTTHWMPLPEAPDA